METMTECKRQWVTPQGPSLHVQGWYSTALNGVSCGMPEPLTGRYLGSKGRDRPDGPSRCPRASRVTSLGLTDRVWVTAPKCWAPGWEK